LKMGKMVRQDDQRVRSLQKGVSKGVVVYGRLYRNLRFMTPAEQARNIEQG